MDSPTRSAPSSPPQGATPPPSNEPLTVEAPSTEPGALLPTSPYFAAVPYLPQGPDLAARITTTAGLLPRLYTGPAFHGARPTGPVYHAAFYDYPRASLPASSLPPLHTDPGAFYVARPADPFGLRPLYPDPMRGDLLLATSSSTDWGGVVTELTMRVSEALRFGDHPPASIEAAAVVAPPMTWVLGASTGELTTPHGRYRPGSGWLSSPSLTASTTALPAIHMLRGESSSSSSHPYLDPTPTSQHSAYTFVSGAATASSASSSPPVPAFPVFQTPRGVNSSSSQQYPYATPTSPQYACIYVSGGVETASPPWRASASTPVPEFQTPRGVNSSSSQQYPYATPTSPQYACIYVYGGAETASPPWRASASTPVPQFQTPQAVSVDVAGASSEVLNPTAQAMDSAAAPSRREEIREKVLHSDPTNVSALLMMPESAGHVIVLLEEGVEETRVPVLTAVKLQIHRIMENPSGSNVFDALLRSSKDHPDELCGIVQAFAERNDAIWGRWILRRAKDSDDIWLNSVQMLFTAISEHEDLCELVLKCLVRENLGCSARGAELLKMCFTILPYEHAKFLIQNAVEEMKSNLHQSHFGSKYLQNCLNHARGDELIAIEKFVINHAREFAMGKYSNFLIQHAIKHGTDEFLCEIFSLFLNLKDSELGELLTGSFSNFVLHILLDTGRTHFPATTRRLEEKISMLPGMTLKHTNARLVVKSIKEAE